MENLSIKEEKIDEEFLKIARITDDFEGYEHPHASRIARIADGLAENFNFALQDRLFLRQAALIHDIGEVVMNRDYIKSRRILGRDERIDMQRHPVIGEQEATKRGFSRAVSLLIRWHHEWWNGEGYPDKLTGGQIPLAARILRVADTFAALTDSRPYSVAVSESDAKRTLTEWAGIEFDPKVVKAFLSLEDSDEIRSFAEKDLKSVV